MITTRRRFLGLAAETAFWITFTLPWIALGVISSIGFVASRTDPATVAAVQVRLTDRNEAPTFAGQQFVVRAGVAAGADVVLNSFTDRPEDHALAADLAARIIPTEQELKLGVVTALFGAPLFALVAWRAARSWRATPTG